MAATRGRRTLRSCCWLLWHGRRSISWLTRKPRAVWSLQNSPNKRRKCGLLLRWLRLLGRLAWRRVRRWPKRGVLLSHGVSLEGNTAWRRCSAAWGRRSVAPWWRCHLKEPRRRLSNKSCRLLLLLELRGWHVFGRDLHIHNRACGALIGHRLLAKLELLWRCKLLLWRRKLVLLLWWSRLGGALLDARWWQQPWTRQWAHALRRCTRVAKSRLNKERLVNKIVQSRDKE